MLFAACAAVSVAMLSAEAAAAEGSVPATFFFTPGCRMCRQTKEAVRAAETRFGAQLSVEWVDLSDPLTGSASARRLFALLDAHAVGDTPSLAFFVGDTCLAGGETIIADVAMAVDAALAAPRSSQVEPVAHDRLGFWTVSAAALADGINPCAFATIL